MSFSFCRISKTIGEAISPYVRTPGFRGVLSTLWIEKLCLSVPQFPTYQWPGSTARRILLGGPSLAPRKPREDSMALWLRPWLQDSHCWSPGSVVATGNCLPQARCGALRSASPPFCSSPSEYFSSHSEMCIECLVSRLDSYAPSHVGMGEGR